MTERASRAAGGLLLGLLGLSVGFGGCFIEAAQPASFRFECSADSDCGEGLSCANNLCQQACGGAEDAPCPSDASECLNGYCSSFCATDQDVCPAPQECVDIFGIFGLEGVPGLCTVPCSVNEDCGEGQGCLEGLCATLCADDSNCAEGEVCTFGLCTPENLGGGSGFP